MTGRLGRTIESILVAIAWVVLVLGSAVAVLTVPVYTSAAVQALAVPESAGLSTADTVRLSGMVRSLVADPGYDPLPSTWRGQPAFDAEAISHLMDVRAVVSGARVATAAAAALLAVWVGAGIARRRWDRLRAGMRSGAIAVLAVVGLACAVALLDFESFFTAFHGVFFKAGTWLFPYDSLLIRLFPERFWVTSGISWGVVSAALAGALLAAASHVRGVASRPGYRDTRGHARG